MHNDAYAIGYEHRPNEFGMAYGPTPNLDEMLEVMPGDDECAACLFRFDETNGTEEIIYRWQDGGWRKE